MFVSSRNYFSKIFTSVILLILLTSCVTKVRPDLGEYVANKIGKIDVALVLGGGGSRGIAHLGAIEVLQENNIPINLIVGSSAGSAIGALYADSQDIAKIKAVLFKAQNKDLLDFSFIELLRMFHNPTTPIVGQAYEDFIYNNLTAKRFNKLQIPLAIVTVDAKTGKKFVITGGEIAPAVRASSAIPPVIAPVTIYNRTLFDGGILEPVPVATAKQYNPKFTIAIDISTNAPDTMPKNALALVYKAFWLSYYQLSRAQSVTADVDIHPDLSGHGTFEDHRKQELYDLGRKAAQEALPEIKRKLALIGIVIR